MECSVCFPNFDAAVLIFELCVEVGQFLFLAVRFAFQADSLCVQAAAIGVISVIAKSIVVCWDHIDPAVQMERIVRVVQMECIVPVVQMECTVLAVQMEYTHTELVDFDNFHTDTLGISPFRLISL